MRCLRSHPKQGKRSLYVGKDGLLQTINLHRTVTASKPAGNAIARIYDRVQERLDRGKEPPFGPAPVTRIEVMKMLKKPHNDFAAIALFNDPFADLRVGYAPDQLPPSAWWGEYVRLRRTTTHDQTIELMGLQGGAPAQYKAAYDVPVPSLVSKGANWPGWKHGLLEAGVSLLLDAGK